MAGKPIITVAMDKRLKTLDGFLKDKRPRSKFEIGCIRRQIDDLRTGHKRNLVWDEDEAVRACNFFKLLRHYQGSGWEWSRQPFELVPWQSDCVIAPMFGWYIGDTKENGGRRRFRRAGISISRKNGKALALDTPIPTPDGWKTMEQLQVGDRVYSGSGGICNVTAITDVQYGRPCYFVKFGSGDWIIADEHHEWPINIYGKNRLLETNQLFPYAQLIDGRDSGHWIEDIRECESVPVKCIEVDSFDHLYLICYGLIPTHNSTICAGIGLQGLLADGEDAPRVYSVATARQQAREVFDAAKEMLGPELRNFSGLDVRAHSILFNPTNGIFEPKCSEAGSLDGMNVHRAIIDELHAHSNRSVWDVMVNSTSARLNAMIAWISYAGYDRTSIWYEQQTYLEKILLGELDDDSYFGFVARAEADDDWSDPDTWLKGNPNFEVCVNRDDFENQHKAAKFSPQAEVDFKRSRLNLITESAVHWMPMHLWDQCGSLDVHAPNYSTKRRAFEDELRGRTCYAGLDLSSTRDLTAWGLVFPDDDGFKFLVRTFAPKSANSDRAKYDRQGYDGWAAQGLINLTDGDTIDYNEVKRVIEQDMAKFKIDAIAIDPYNLAYFYKDCVEERGWPDDICEEFKQYPSYYNEPMSRLMELVKERKIEHGNCPVLRWCMANMVAKMDDRGYIKPDKAKSQDKIDGAVAVIMGLALALQRIDRVPIGRFYENNEIEFG